MHLPRIAVLLVLTTIPLLFGAVHPIVLSLYICIVLLGLGGWLLLRQPGAAETAVSWRWLLPVVLLLVWMALQSLPLPLSWMDLLSPARAERVRLVGLLTGEERNFLPITDQGAASLQQVVLFLALLLYFFSVRALLRDHPPFMYTIAGAIALAGTFEALYGLFQFLRPQLGVLWLPIPARAAHGTIIYKNQYAALLNMCWPVTCAMAVAYLRKIFSVETGRSARRLFGQVLRNLNRKNNLAALYLFATGIMLLAVLFSLSRGGIIAMLVVLFSLNLALPLSRKTKIVVSACLLAFLGGYGMLLGLETVVNRFNSIDQSGLGRISVYLGSLPMLRDHWLTGIGLGSYDLLSPVYLKGMPPQIHFDHAHNEYLEFALELGLPAALLLFGWLGAVMLSAGRKLARLNRSPARHTASTMLGSAAFCGLLGFFMHGWADFGWRLPANLFYAATLGALLAAALEAQSLEKKARMAMQGDS